MGQIPTDEHDTCNRDDGDEREDECVLRETLSFPAAKAEEHDASFLWRRLAFVATFGRAVEPGASRS